MTLAIVTEAGAVVPPLFRWELQSALAVAVRRGKATMAEAEGHLDNFDALKLQIDDLTLSASFHYGWEIAQQHGLTPYDAAYLELAQRRSLRLMTRDAQLARAADSIGLLWRP